MALANGVVQWVFQRIANLFIVLFAVFIFATLIKGLSYESLLALSSAVWFKAFAFITLVLGCLNSILAGWQIVGDYARKFHLPENVLMAFVSVTTILFFVAGIILIF